MDTQVTADGRRVEESRRRGIRIQPVAKIEQATALPRRPTTHTSSVLSFSQPPPLEAASEVNKEEESVFLLQRLPTTTRRTTRAPVQAIRQSPSAHTSLSIDEEPPTQAIAAQSNHLTDDQHSQQVHSQATVQRLKPEALETRRTRNPEAFEVFDATTNTFTPPSQPTKDTFQPVQASKNVAEDDFGDTAVAPQAEPLSLHQGGDDGFGLSEAEKKAEEEERRRGIEQWMATRRGVRPTTTSLLPSPIQIHQAVPSLQEQEDIDLIDQIFDDAIFGASEVNEVKRKVDDVHALLETEDMRSDASDVIYDVFHEEKEKETEEVEEPKVDHVGVWRNIETKFEQLPPLYRSQIKYQPAKKASVLPEKKSQFSIEKQKSHERKYSATPVPLVPLPTVPPQTQVNTYIGLGPLTCSIPTNHHDNVAQVKDVAAPQPHLSAEQESNQVVTDDPYLEYYSLPTTSQPDPLFHHQPQLHQPGDNFEVPDYLESPALPSVINPYEYPSNTWTEIVHDDSPSYNNQQIEDDIISNTQQDYSDEYDSYPFGSRSVPSYFPLIDQLFFQRKSIACCNLARSPQRGGR